MTTEESLADRVAHLEKQVEKLQRFKDWVHSYLDRQGVPHHPPGVHGAEGCRIGDRMDWLMARIATLERELAESDERACANGAKAARGYGLLIRASDLLGLLDGEVVRLRETIRVLSERCAGQSEALARAAAKNKALAEAIATDLFTTHRGDLASRLVSVSEEPGFTAGITGARDNGGWSLEVVRDLIERHLAAKETP